MSFDLLAPHYSWLETVLAGPPLQRCRLAWLDALKGCETTLIVGVGHGHFLRRCARRFPQARITCVDASAGMLQQARRGALRAGVRADRLTFVHASLPEWQPEAAAFDAIVTPFFLDCFPPPELAVVIASLSRAARPEARWLVADFTVPERGLARVRARAVHGLMYAVFRRVTKIRASRVTAPDALLTGEGFQLVARRTFEWGLLHSDLWQRSGT